MKILSFKTSLGWITLEEKSNKVQKIKFAKKKNFGKSIKLNRLKDQIIKFCLGKKKTIKIKITTSGTLIQKQIWKELSKIPYGSTKSYGEVAAKVKTSPRYVGNVCGQNQYLLVIPCHRVIRSDGNLGGFSARGGVKLKKKILDLEKKNV